MAINLSTESQTEFQLTLPQQQACDDYLDFFTNILKPATEDLDVRVRAHAVTLHQAFGANLVAAHSIDYLLAVRTATGKSENRKSFIAAFDEQFSVPGAYLRNRKMELIDAINNGLKHIQLDLKRYKKLGERYGQISFRSLVEYDGRIMCHLDKFRFDYCRVVLLPTLKTLSSWQLHTVEDVLEFAQGDFGPISVADPRDVYDPDDPSTAIDRLIDLCAPPCANCEEAPDECHCSQYVFDGEYGRYEPLYSTSKGELEELMSQISPSFKRS